MSSKQFNIEVGDILIVQGKSNMSKILVQAQKPFYFKNTASHILIAIADGFYIHATGDKGVHVITFKEILPQIENNWKAIRLKSLVEDQKSRLMEVVNFYRGQGYNKKFFIPVQDASFCSELAAKIYQQADISILNDLNPQYIKPSNFDKEAERQNEWVDITIETRDIFEKFDKESYFKILELCQQRVYSLIDHRRDMDKFLEQIFLSDDSTLVTDDFKDKFRKIKQDAAEKVKVPYWDDTFKKVKNK